MKIIWLHYVDIYNIYIPQPSQLQYLSTLLTCPGDYNTDPDKNKSRRRDADKKNKSRRRDKHDYISLQNTVLMTNSTAVTWRPNVTLPAGHYS